MREKQKILYQVFTRKTKDGSMHTILNLKHLNKYVKSNHFKMERILDGLTLSN